VQNDELSKQAQSSLGDFLGSHTWDAFITSTFARPVNYPRTAIEKCARQLFEHPSERAFLAAESFKLGHWHVHGLVKWYSPTEATNHFAEIRLRRLGFNHVEVVNSERRVAAYCSKYVTKFDGEWEIYGFHW
jgi:hypothetical protein